MLSINSTDINEKALFILNPQDITFIKDVQKNITQSVVLPYEFYQSIKDKIEDEFYLFENNKALSNSSYKEFLDIEESFVEDLNR